MRLMTFNEILTKLCDDFDALISPKSISRSNTNIIYLIFKAISKGYELINNVCVTLSNKFNPALCAIEDLDSVAKLVGTDRYTGSATGLRITITNPKEEAVTLVTGIYTYKLDENTSFYFDFLSDTEIEAKSYITVLAMTEKLGSFPVTAQDSISVLFDEAPLDNGLVFSCSDNSSLLGVQKESDLEFRKRVLTGVNNQDAIVELETSLKKLPYIFDCRCKFNQTTTPAVYDGYTIPPYTLAIFFSGMARNEIAEIVASKTIFPTLAVEGESIPLKFKNNVFIEGEYDVNVIPFKETLFDVHIITKINERYATIDSVEADIRSALINNFATQVHSDYIKEDDVYNVLERLNIAGLDILGVDLIYDDEVVNFIEVPVSRIPRINTITFTQR